MHRVDTSRANWRKSSRSGGANGGGGECVEVAAVPGHTAVRDSKNPGDTALTFDPRGWAAFVAGVKRGDYQ